MLILISNRGERGFTMNKHTRRLVNQEISSEIRLHNLAVDSMIVAVTENEWQFYESERSKHLHAIRCMIDICNDVDLHYVYRLEFKDAFIHSHCNLVVEKVEG